MFNFTIYFSDPSKNSYYLSIIIVIFIILLIIQLIIMLIKKLRNDSRDELSPSLKYYFKKLKISYLLAFILSRSAMWAQAPYIFILFKTVRKYTNEKINILYLVESISSLIFGPISGLYADVTGRSEVCILYNVILFIYLYNIFMGFVYFGQITNGFGNEIINTTFEAWVVSETNDVNISYKKGVERFKKKLFKNVNILDATANIFITGICSIIYSFLEEYSPFLGICIIYLLSYCLSFASLDIIIDRWYKNRISLNKSKNCLYHFEEAFNELRKVNVLFIGLIESINLIILYIFLFSWTPILKQSTEKEINIGYIYTCMVLTMIIGTKLYEILIIYYNFNYYMSITGCSFIQGLLLYMTYFDNRFLARLIYLSLFNGLIGFYNPLNSIVKSIILIEEYRALLMNIFRIPYNIYVIISLFKLKNINPLKLILFMGHLSFVALVLDYFYVFIFIFILKIMNLKKKK